MAGIFIWLGIGVVIGAGAFFATIVIPQILDWKDEMEKMKHEERDSFLRCQAYLDRGDAKNENDAAD